MSLPPAPDRVRSFGYFVIAGVYFLFAQALAAHSAAGLSSGAWSILVGRAMLLFLLLLGYAGMGRAFQQQRRPLSAMGLVVRPGWKREFGLGAALGWGMLLASILPMFLVGGLVVTLWTVPRQFLLLGLDLVVLAVASLAEEVVFRGYPFQRLVEAIGPTAATIVISVLFALAHGFNPDVNRVGLIAAVFAGWLLCAGYLRTRALWFSWGWHFAWNASMGLLFGLPISGITRFAPVIQSNTIGPVWITGGDYGPEGSLIAVIVLLAGLFLVFRITRVYAYRYANPVIHPAGMPVDLDAMGRVLAPHHPPESASENSEKLVQIRPFRGSPTAVPSSTAEAPKAQGSSPSSGSSVGSESPSQENPAGSREEENRG